MLVTQFASAVWVVVEVLIVVYLVVAIAYGCYFHR